MAIYPSVPPPAQQAAVEVESSSGSPARATLSTPLDKVKPPTTGKKEPLRRDSMKTRDALRKGKEGSRRRQRWENDRLLHVPNAQPPLPSDWEVHSTSPIRSIPYYLAPLWDAGIRHRAEEVAATKATSKTSPDQAKGRVPQELRQKLKKARGAKSLLQDLEEEIRAFVKEWEQREHWEASEGDVLDSEDEEIVFVGRNGMSDDDRFVLEEVVEEELEREKLVWESAVGDQGAGFGRYLVHSIAAYYGLSSRSVTVGNPARREAYVGIKDLRKEELPRPLWGLV